ncbi:uncharacterized protein BJ171DRAFT_603081 [Polychytrium aggregatum]|uniref:uncharacterized protein n=1 Tax=Polychytrium aggregatum TaxID=110093 RepID=UPI0022FEBF38|nr:uncharacterized protein BJ171DRAFT_603081 [Polychytrium aggregatum]KAI9193657.1 hypothetical protein BJ171DRAFT_603081 [Polychytrium aggregatum]
MSYNISSPTYGFASVQPSKSPQLGKAAAASTKGAKGAKIGTPEQNRKHQQGQQLLQQQQLQTAIRAQLREVDGLRSQVGRARLSNETRFQNLDAQSVDQLQALNHSLFRELQSLRHPGQNTNIYGSMGTTVRSPALSASAKSSRSDKAPGTKQASQESKSPRSQPSKIATQDWINQKLGQASQEPYLSTRPTAMQMSPHDEEISWTMLPGNARAANDQRLKYATGPVQKNEQISWDMLSVKVQTAYRQYAHNRSPRLANMSTERGDDIAWSMLPNRAQDTYQRLSAQATPATSTPARSRNPSSSPQKLTTLANDQITWSMLSAKAQDSYRAHSSQASSQPQSKAHSRQSSSSPTGNTPDVWADYISPSNPVVIERQTNGAKAQSGSLKPQTRPERSRSASSGRSRQSSNSSPVGDTPDIWAEYISPGRSIVVEKTSGRPGPKAAAPAPTLSRPASRPVSAPARRSRQSSNSSPVGDTPDVWADYISPGKDIVIERSLKTVAGSSASTAAKLTTAPAKTIRAPRPTSASAASSRSRQSSNPSPTGNTPEVWADYISSGRDVVIELNKGASKAAKKPVQSAEKSTIKPTWASYLKKDSSLAHQKPQAQPNSAQSRRKNQEISLDVDGPSIWEHFWDYDEETETVSPIRSRTASQQPRVAAKTPKVERPYMNFSNNIPYTLHRDSEESTSYMIPNHREIEDYQLSMLSLRSKRPAAVSTVPVPSGVASKSPKAKSPKAKSPQTRSDPQAKTRAQEIVAQTSRSRAPSTSIVTATVVASAAVLVAIGLRFFGQGSV